MKSGNNFAFTDFGPFANIDQYFFEHPKLGTKVPGKNFLKEILDLSSMEVSINKLPPGGAMPFSHKHRENEELYLFLKGKGEFCVDGEWFDVQEGSAVRVSPDGVRTWRSSKADELVFIVIQAKAGTMNGNTIEDGVRVSQP
ncbi:cupin domain-containing protein [uncultured Bdellovibrio sp.]|uniref:cupin domain-containing protein n=1 Tax=Bdellovibrio sp. HCB-162 TaxID=3394234 RepID=UPI0025CEC61F|nr:cupin domain-containing protein [uncultured Bdellovibrio sp.]